MNEAPWPPPEVRRYPDARRLGRAAAGVVAEAAEDGVRARGRFTLVLSGGRTPRPLFDVLTGPPHSAGLPWDRTHVFWADERCVSADHPDSNFLMARDGLLSAVPIPSANVHRIPAEKGPAAAAPAYDAELRRFFAPEPVSLDLVLLGLGPDGHTASLFPGDDALRSRGRLAAGVREGVGTPAHARVTLTLAAINSARLVVFLASSEGKEAVLDSILRRPGEAALLPAAMVRPAGRLLWMVAGPAASARGSSSSAPRRGFGPKP